MRLRDIINNMSIRDGMGVIIRTVGIGEKICRFGRDLHISRQMFSSRKYQRVSKHEILYSEPDLMECTVSDSAINDIESAINTSAARRKRPSWTSTSFACGEKSGAQCGRRR
jgi:ribonuclease G